MEIGSSKFVLFSCHYCKRREVKIELAPFMVTVVTIDCNTFVSVETQILCGETGWTSGVISPLMFHSSADDQDRELLDPQLG